MIVIEIIALTHRLESNHLYTYFVQSCYILLLQKNCSTANSNINEDKKERERNRREESIVVIIVIIVTITIKTTISNIMITMQKKREKEIYHIMKVS